MTGPALDIVPPIKEGRLQRRGSPRGLLGRMVDPMRRKPLAPTARLFTALVAILLAFSVGTATARANPPYRVSVTPAKLVAGSSVSVLTFQFSAVNAAKGWNTVQVPAVASGSAWSAPQSSNPADPGFVAVSNQTCSSASLSSITGAAGGPWTILVNATCAKNGRFAIRYGAGPSPVTVATNAGPYVFHATRVIAQPVVNVIAGPAATLDVTGLADAAAGTPQSPTVTATDAYGNTATRYRGTVHFTGSGDPPFQSFFFVVAWDVPADYTFTAGDAGAHTFAATANYAGTQTLTAADTRPSSITGSQTITISPGPAGVCGHVPEIQRRIGDSGTDHRNDLRRLSVGRLRQRRDERQRVRERHRYQGGFGLW